VKLDEVYGEEYLLLEQVIIGIEICYLVKHIQEDCQKKKYNKTTKVIL